MMLLRCTIGILKLIISEVQINSRYFFTFFIDILYFKENNMGICDIKILRRHYGIMLITIDISRFCTVPCSPERKLRSTLGEFTAHRGIY